MSQMNQGGVSAEFLLEQISAFVVDCQRALVEGNHVELAGLDRKVALLCEAALALPPEEGKQFGTHLETLLGALNALQKSMEAERDETQRQIDGLGLQRRAHMAYSKPESKKTDQES